MATYNVLSIDFDYFQKVSAETLINCYPDPHDLSTDLSIFVWSSHYANKHCAKQLKQITTDKQKLAAVQKIIRNNSDLSGFNCKTMIANSHVHIYELIHDNILDPNAEINIYNLDMHHDMFPKNKTTNECGKLDCGNWGLHIKKDYPNSTITWIYNPISNELYPSDLPDKSSDNFDELMDMKFDIIFLCRSDAFLPPHLDKDFEELARTIKIYFGRILVDKQTNSKRNISKQVKELQKTFKNLKLEDTK